jgi:hypothetical protein
MAYNRTLFIGGLQEGDVCGGVINGDVLERIAYFVYGGFKVCGVKFFKIPTD